MARNRIQEITVTTKNPSGAPGDMGTCEVGFFTVDGDLLTVVEGNGTPVRQANGERITARLQAGESAHKVASRLLLTYWRNQRDAGEVVPGFGRPLSYEPLGWA